MPDTSPSPPPPPPPPPPSPRAATYPPFPPRFPASGSAVFEQSRHHRSYRYYDLVMAAFVTVLLCSNIIGPGKSCVVTVLGWTVAFGAGNIFFPMSYIFGDVLTEVYGYARARKVIWAGFGAMMFYVVMSQVVIHLPVNPNEPFNEIMQPAIETVFGAGPRIVAASMLAFWLGDFANSYIMAKMKVKTRGRFLWMRTIGSTMVGQGVDSLVFYPLAFASIEPLFGKENLPAFLQGGWTMATIFSVATFNWFFKVMIEVVFTPVTYAICNALKRAEGEDYFDTATNFTPFSLKD